MYIDTYTYREGEAAGERAKDMTMQELFAFPKRKLSRPAWLLCAFH